jgi:hypothetical protein
LSQNGFLKSINLSHFLATKASHCVFESKPLQLQTVWQNRRQFISQKKIHENCLEAEFLDLKGFQGAAISSI